VQEVEGNSRIDVMGELAAAVELRSGHAKNERDEDAGGRCPTTLCCNPDRDVQPSRVNCCGSLNSICAPVYILFPIQSHLLMDSRYLTYLSIRLAGDSFPGGKEAGA
jgi:hypothetical protein